MEQRQNMQGKKMKTFVFNKKLGSGSFGTVYQALNQKSKKQKSVVAIKVISKKTIKSIPKLKQLVESQIKVLNEVKNQNVIKFVDSFSSDYSIFIVTEFCNGGDLQQYCNKEGKLTQDNAVQFLKQILNGFKGLHQINSMHRDFKLANILLHNNICKIADLGFAKQLKDQGLTTTILGTDETMAPEVNQGKQYGWGADIWSIGVVFYQMMFNKLPFKGNQYTILKNMKLNNIGFNGIEISQQAIDFIKKCLTYNPQQRITWTDIYLHPLIKKTELLLNPLLLRSQLNLQENSDYYKKNQKQKQKKITTAKFLEINNGKENTQKAELLFTNVGEIKNVNNEQTQEIIKNKQKIDKIFIQYEQQIIKDRNNAMFGISLILPQQKNLSSIFIDHTKAFYEICKNSFIRLKKMRHKIQNDSYGDYKGYQFWKEFKKLNIFNTIKQQLKEDQMLAEALTIGYSSQETLKKQNYNRATSEEKSKQILENYWKSLIPHFKKEEKNKKSQLYKILKALQYMKKNRNLKYEAFQKDFKNLNYQAYEKQLEQVS